MEINYPFNVAENYTLPDSMKITGGKVQLKDQTPDNVLFYAGYQLNKDANYCDGTPTGILGGTANVHDDYLDLTDGNAYIEYPIDSFISMTENTDCIRLRLSFNYSGAAPSIQYILQTNSNTASRVYLVHNTTFIQCYITNSASATIYNMTFSWTPNQGQIYEFEINWNSTHAYIFINGIKQNDDTGVLSMNAPGLFRLGQSSNAMIKIYDILVYDTLQHSSNYTLNWSIIPETKYSKENLIGYVNSTFRADQIENFEAIINKTGNDEVYFILISNSIKYYNNNGIWEESNGEYPQCNTLEEIQEYMDSFIEEGYGGDIKISWILYSDNGYTTPQLLNITIGYNFFGALPVLTENIIYGWLYKIDGIPSTPYVLLKTVTYLILNQIIIVSDPVIISVQDNGYFEARIITEEGIEEPSELIWQFNGKKFKTNFLPGYHKFSELTRLT